MRVLPQWCIAGPDKAPYAMGNNGLYNAKVTEGRYHTFEDAVVIAEKYGAGIGFILTKDDPFVCIDLDIKDIQSRDKDGRTIDASKWTSVKALERYEKIIEAFDSYTELSASGKGAHVWVKGYTGKGARRDGVEVYSQERFIICTGFAINSVKYEIDNNIVYARVISSELRNVEDRPELLEMLVSEMRAVPDDVELEELRESKSDDDIMEMAMYADNAQKFTDLCNGMWQSYEYPSQSEADLSLMAMFAFYSQSNEQCRRLFRMTQLGKREKAVKNDRYLNNTLRAIRAKQKADEQIKINLQEQSERVLSKARAKLNSHMSLPSSSSEPESEDYEIEFPPGLAGKLAQYIYGTSIRPVKEVAITAALGFLAGVCGKSFHIPQSGLNQYIILIARSAVGKEAMHSGLSLLLDKLRSAIPRVSDFVTFVDYASGQALQKACLLNTSFVSVSGEWGRKLKRLAMEDSHDGPMQQMRTVMTNLYQKSGPASIVGGMSYSSQEQNIASVSGVAYSMIGETTPGTFYDSLTESMMEDGFLSRFIVLEYAGQRPAINKHPVLVPDAHLTEALCFMVEHSINLLTRGQHVLVEYAPDVKQMLDAYDVICDNEINGSENEGWRQMWNRAHLKVCRLAALLAVVDNPVNPVVQRNHAEWAMNVIKQNIRIFKRKLADGSIGQNDLARERKLVSFLRDFIDPSNKLPAGYSVNESMRRDGIVPRKYLQSRAYSVSCFYSNRTGSNVAFDTTIRSAIDNGFIAEVDKKDVVGKYGASGKCYQILDLPDYISK